LIDVFPDILQILDSDAHTDETRYDARFTANLFRHETVAGIGGTFDERTDATEARRLEDNVQ
jgi:hypothetical protein